jgi:hypothetical protein
MLSRIFGGTAGGLVGGLSGASILTGLGLVTLGPVGAGIGFGLGAITGTAGGVLAGNELAKKIEGRE